MAEAICGVRAVVPPSATKPIKAVLSFMRHLQFNGEKTPRND